MFSNVVESILRNAGAGFITEAFIFTMILVFLFALVLSRAGTWRSFTNYTATLLTSLGILGTFAGVVTGLLDFDSSVEQIDNSIGLLLLGLKTAFTSSLVGMALSVLYKVIVLTPFFSSKVRDSSEQGITIETLYDVEIEQKKYMRATAKALAGKENSSVLKLLKSISECMTSIQNRMDISAKQQRITSEEQQITREKILNVLSDDGESSLTGQLKLARSDANDVGKNIAAEVEKLSAAARFQSEQEVQWQKERKQISEEIFGQLNVARLDAVNHAQEANEHRKSMVSLLERSPTETLIAALEDVIKDFNKHISEQFGENFKELNSAVGRMIEWQENYRTQLSELQRAFDVSVQAVGECERSLNSIEQSSESIPSHMTTLSEVMKVSQLQLNDLEAHLQGFAEVKQRAVESLPLLHKTVEDVVNSLSDSTGRMIASCESNNQNFIHATNTSVSDMTQSSQLLNTQLTQVAQRTGAELQTMLDGLRDSIETHFRQSSASVDALIKKEFEDMEQVRQAEVQNIMQQMGAALTSITGQFTKDYRSLVIAMKEVVSTGEQRGV